MAKGYSGKEIPKKEGFTGKKVKTNDLYMKNGVPCGDIEAVGPSGKGPSGAGAGPKVGGYPMGIHHAFANGVPNAGREDISVEVMKPVHKENIDRKVFTSIGDDQSDDKAADASEIRPVDMKATNSFGIPR